MSNSQQAPIRKKMILKPRINRDEEIDNPKKNSKEVIADEDSDYEFDSDSDNECWPPVETQDDCESDSDSENEDESNQVNSGENLNNDMEGKQDRKGFKEDGSLEISSDNPFIKALLDGVKYEKWHERNDSYTTHNIILVTENKWQQDKKPTEDMAKATLNYFRQCNPSFIEYDKYSMPQLIRYYWEFKYVVFMKVHNDGTSKFVTMHVNQLRNDLKKKYPKHNKLPNNWRDFLGWHASYEGAKENEIAWNSRQKPFDSKENMKEVAKYFHINLAVGYTQRNKKGWIETINRYSKRLTQKNIQEKRKTHGKLLRSTFPNNKKPKKNNPDEYTIKKRTVGEFDDDFVYFKGPSDIEGYNDWVIENGGTEKDKIPMPVVEASKKPRPSLKINLTSFTDTTDSFELMGIDELDCNVILKAEPIARKSNKKKGNNTKASKQPSSSQPTSTSRKRACEKTGTIKKRRNKKKTKENKDGNDDPADDESLEEQRFESLNDNANDDLNETFAQPVEKPSLHRNASKTNEKEPPKKERNAMPTVCEYRENHAKLDDANLKEESNNNYLNDEQIMDGITCSQCGKRLVKNKNKMSKSAAKEVSVFSKKRTVMCCNELLTWGPAVCRFCICFDCKHKLYEDENKHKEGNSKRRSRRNN